MTPRSEASRVRPGVRLWLSILIGLCVFVLGTLGYMFIEGQPPLKSLYMTVITLSTVGYREVFELDTKGMVFTIVLIVVGYIALGIAIANLISFVVSGEFLAIRGRVRMKARIDHLDKHVIVCGYGRMGAQLSAQLARERTPFVAIDRAVTERLEDEGILFVEGDATEDTTLKAAGIERAKALVTCLASDADNVFVTLSAREMRPTLTILARAEQPASEHKLIRAGASAVICPQSIGAQKMAHILCRPHVVELIDMASKGVDIEIAQYEVPASSPLAGKALRESRIRERMSMMVVAIKRPDGRQLFSPGPEETINAGDQLVLIGPGGQASRLNELT